MVSSIRLSAFLLSATTSLLPVFVLALWNLFNTCFLTARWPPVFFPGSSLACFWPPLFRLLSLFATSFFVFLRVSSVSSLRFLFTCSMLVSSVFGGPGMTFAFVASALLLLTLLSVLYPVYVATSLCSFAVFDLPVVVGFLYVSGGVVELLRLLLTITSLSTSSTVQFYPQGEPAIQLLDGSVDW